MGREAGKGNCPVGTPQVRDYPSYCSSSELLLGPSKKRECKGRCMKGSAEKEKAGQRKGQKSSS